MDAVTSSMLVNAGAQFPGCAIRLNTEFNGFAHPSGTACGFVPTDWDRKNSVSIRWKPEPPPIHRKYFDGTHPPAAKA